jgi:hypothetical protein
MIKLVHPKKVLIVSHFATYQRGHRYDLIQILKNFCNEKNIPFIDPSILFEKYKVDDILINEPVLAHYTQEGEKLIGEMYQTKIKQIFKEN